jgi:hypothetical protein
MYYNDAHYKDLTLEKIDTADRHVYWYDHGRPDYVTDSTLSIRWEGKLISDGNGKAPVPHQMLRAQAIYFLDGKELPFVYKSVEVYTDSVELTAGQGIQILP